MRSIPLMFIILVLASACNRTAAPPQEPILPVVCRAGADCDAKWSRAVAWVTNNSGYKIQVQTEALIQTYGPANGDTWLAATVNKVAKGGDQYEIAGALSCGNMFGCYPAPRAALLEFNRFVKG
jgi:hypothetical protein